MLYHNQKGGGGEGWSHKASYVKSPAIGTLIYPRPAACQTAILNYLLSHYSLARKAGVRRGIIIVNLADSQWAECNLSKVGVVR